MEMPHIVPQPTTIKLLEEKYGGPLNQHSQAATLDFYHQRKISLKMIAQKMYHLVAIPFKIEKRNFFPKG